MATVATYEFSDEHKARDVKDKINFECGMSSAQCYGNKVEISDECSDISKASQICEANGGN